MPEVQAHQAGIAESSSENTRASASSTGPRASAIADVAAELLRDARERRRVEAARPEARERVEVAVDVEREAVARDPAVDADAERRDLAVLDPHADVLAVLAGDRADPELGERLDQDALEVVRVLAQILAVVAQVEDRVADELPGPVPGRAAAAIGPQHLPAERAVGLLAADELCGGVGRAPERERRRVLAEDDRVGHGALRARGGEIELQPVDLGERARLGQQVVDVRGVEDGLGHPAVGFGSTGFGRSCAPVPVLSDGTCSGPAPR